MSAVVGWSGGTPIVQMDLNQPGWTVIDAESDWLPQVGQRFIIRDYDFSEGYRASVVVTSADPAKYGPGTVVYFKVVSEWVETA